MAETVQLKEKKKKRDRSKVLGTGTQEQYRTEIFMATTKHTQQERQKSMQIQKQDKTDVTVTWTA